MKNSKQDSPIKFFVALQGNKEPKDYIKIAKLSEKLGFDRIYVYDDLMYHSSSQILTLIAEHTKKIEIGPCLLNGFYRHPAIIAQETAFLNEIAPGRVTLGMGRGAFFDFLNLDDSEEFTREAFSETIQQVKRFLSGNKNELYGKIFNATEKAFLRNKIPQQKIKMVAGTWNLKMAETAAQNDVDELQTAIIWDKKYLHEINSKLKTSEKEIKLNIGGMSCISNDRKKAYSEAKKTLAVYIPYLARLISKFGYDTNDDYFRKIFKLSKLGKYKDCENLIKDELVDKLAPVGTPEEISEKIINLNKAVKINAVMFSPPYGTESLESNLKFISKNLIPKVLKNL